jgi:hypothetical protein
MLPPEFLRDLERLAGDAAGARARLAGIRERLAAVRSMVDHLVASARPSVRPTAPDDGDDTPRDEVTQERGQAKVG